MFDELVEMLGLDGQSDAFGGEAGRDERLAALASRVKGA